MNDADRLVLLRALLASAGPALPDLLEELLGLIHLLPDRWLEKPPDHGLEYLRYRLEMSQYDLARKAGITQSRYSKIEGGADALMSTWRRLYGAMGFTLVLLPISRASAAELKERAQIGRTRRYWQFQGKRRRPKPM